AGYYDYQGRTPVPAPELDRIAAGLADAHGIARRTDIDQDEMAERLLYPLINEGLHILHEGISYRPGDIDVVWTAGYGFPADRGGPMFMADQIGLRKIADRLAHYAAVSGDPFGYWTPSPLLTRLAEANETISDWAARRSKPETIHA
ncbi:MAG: 3-hydroxyacyl-CoA dehydrogenase family protein, partial [Janthinobacterium lividum]